MPVTAVFTSPPGRGRAGLRPAGERRSATRQRDRAEQAQRSFRGLCGGDFARLAADQRGVLDQGFVELVAQRMKGPLAV